jgi:hypothetical protein
MKYKNKIVVIVQLISKLYRVYQNSTDKLSGLILWSKISIKLLNTYGVENAHEEHRTEDKTNNIMVF